MKKIICLFILLTNCIAVTHAKLPAKCIDRLISKSEGMLVKVEDAINRNDRLPANDHQQILKYWGEFNTYVKSSWTQDCYAAAPENKNKYYKFYNDTARPIMFKAIARQNELCSSVTNKVVEAGMKAINDEIARNSTSGAEGRISALEFKLKQKPIILNCSPVKDKIASIINEELPMLRNNLNAMQHINKISYNYKSVVGPWDDAHRAFKNKSLAPKFFEGSQGQIDYKISLGSCLEAVIGLEKMNFNNTKILTKYRGKNVTLSGVKNGCSEVADFGLAKLFAKVTGHNKNYWAKWRASWIAKNIKGKAMQKVYDTNKGITPVVKINSKTKNISWSYRSYTTNHLFNQCKIYSFGASGQTLIWHQNTLCE